MHKPKNGGFFRGPPFFINGKLLYETAFSLKLHQFLPVQTPADHSIQYVHTGRQSCQGNDAILLEGNLPHNGTQDIAQA